MNAKQTLLSAIDAAIEAAPCETMPHKFGGGYLSSIVYGDRLQMQEALIQLISLPDIPPAKGAIKDLEKDAYNLEMKRQDEITEMCYLESAIPKTPAYERITFMADGCEYRVFNERVALEAFRAQVKREFPDANKEATPRKPRKVALPGPSKPHARIPASAMVGVMQIGGRAAYSIEGHCLIFGEWDGKANEDLSDKMKRRGLDIVNGFMREEHTAIESAVFCYYGADNGAGISDKPLALKFADNEARGAYVRLEGGAGIVRYFNQTYYNHVRAAHPNATLVLSGEFALLALDHNGTFQAAVMCNNIGEQAKKAIEAIIEETRAAEMPAITTAPKPSRRALRTLEAMGIAA